MRWTIPVLLTLSLTPCVACAEGGPDMSSSIEEVRAEHVDRLMAVPGVVSVGIGLDSAGDSAIVIGLEAPSPETEASLPDTLDGYPVVVQVVGRIRAR
jgi:hypothetical protein